MTAYDEHGRPIDEPQRDDHLRCACCGDPLSNSGSTGPYCGSVCERYDSMIDGAMAYDWRIAVSVATAA